MPIVRHLKSNNQNFEDRDQVFTNSPCPQGVWCRVLGAGYSVLPLLLHCILEINISNITGFLPLP